MLVAAQYGYVITREPEFLTTPALSLQGVEKTIVSKMLEKGSSRRTFAVDRHAGVVQPHPCPEIMSASLWNKY